LVGSALKRNGRCGLIPGAAATLLPAGIAPTLHFLYNRQAGRRMCRGFGWIPATLVKSIPGRKRQAQQQALSWISTHPQLIHALISDRTCHAVPPHGHSHWSIHRHRIPRRSSHDALMSKQAVKAASLTAPIPTPRRRSASIFYLIVLPQAGRNDCCLAARNFTHAHPQAHAQKHMQLHPCARACAHTHAHTHTHTRMHTKKFYTRFLQGAAQMANNHPLLTPNQGQN
jgi:hypothetical protein